MSRARPTDRKVMKYTEIDIAGGPVEERASE
jgi:hypothetical protein